MNPNYNVELFVGIDLGTTYSSISYYEPKTKDSVVVQSNATTSTYASYVSLKYNKKDDKYFHQCGNEAKANGFTSTAYDSKRLIGKLYSDYEKIGNEKDGWSFDVVEDENGFCKMRITNPNQKSENQYEDFYPEEITSLVVGYLLKLLREKVGNTKINTIVVTIPVEFSPSQRSATVRACKLAGIQNIELINEPSASIIDYKHFIESKNYGHLKENTQILVIDFGGGTLDICCCKIVPKEYYSITLLIGFF